MVKTKEINNWQDFLLLAEKLSSDGPEGPIIFRGQSKEEWGLTPSLTRILKKNELNQQQGLLIEDKALKAFQRKAHLAAEFCEGLRPNDPLHWWEIMQHYNAPTRLLDWSSSPYVALYYAVEDLSEKDGALFSFDAAHLSFVKIARSDSNDLDWAAHHFKQLDKSLINAEYEKTIIVVGCPKPTDRMVAQQSEFTVCTELLTDHDDFANQIVYSGVPGGEGHSIVKKYIIPSELKPKFLANLEMMNITANALFPGIDGLGRSIRELICMRSVRVKKPI
jgi:hypothetical protein